MLVDYRFSLNLYFLQWLPFYSGYLLKSQEGVTVLVFIWCFEISRQINSQGLMSCFWNFKTLDWMTLVDYLFTYNLPSPMAASWNFKHCCICSLYLTQQQGCVLKLQDINYISCFTGLFLIYRVLVKFQITGNLSFTNFKSLCVSEGFGNWQMSKKSFQFVKYFRTLKNLTFPQY